MQLHIPLGSSDGAAVRFARSLAATIAIVAFAHLAAAAYCLAMPFRLEPLPYGASAGVLLLLLGGLQLRLARRVWQARAEDRPHAPRCRRLFCRGLLPGLVVCYAAAMLVGPGRAAGLVFGVSAAAWYTAILLMLVGSARRRARVVRWVALRPVRIAGWSLYVLLVAPLGGELGLRAYGLIFHDSGALPCMACCAKLAPGSQCAGLCVNSQGYWDEEFRAERPAGRLRVAAVGDDVMLCGTVHTNFLAQIERSAPRLEIYNFGLPGAGPREYANQVSREVTTYRPHLLLAFVSVANDITHETRGPDPFDWRGLHIVQLAAAWRGPQPEILQASTLPNREPCDYHGYLDRCTRQLAVCRTPISTSMHARWRNVYAHLDRLASTCRSHEIPLALVVSPSELQINRALRETLRRRAGYGPDEIDVELPQRRLAAYARQRDLPLLDLLPAMRTCGESPFERNDARFSNQGNALAAEVVGHWVQQHVRGLITTTASNKPRAAGVSPLSIPPHGFQ